MAAGRHREGEHSRAFQAIWRVVARIPRGRLATYGQIARMAGFPGGARTAGWALAALPDGLRIDGRSVPWHRVVNASGSISPRRGHPPGAAAGRQALRLRRDGVKVRADGTLELSRYLWDGRGRSAGGRSRSPSPGAARASGARRVNCS